MHRLRYAMVFHAAASSPTALLRRHNVGYEFAFRRAEDLFVESEARQQAIGVARSTGLLR